MPSPSPLGRGDKTVPSSPFQASRGGGTLLKSSAAARSALERIPASKETKETPEYVPSPLEGEGGRRPDEGDRFRDDFRLNHSSPLTLALSPQGRGDKTFRLF